MAAADSPVTARRRKSSAGSAGKVRASSPPKKVTSAITRELTWSATWFGVNSPQLPKPGEVLTEREMYLRARSFLDEILLRFDDRKKDRRDHGVGMFLFHGEGDVLEQALEKYPKFRDLDVCIETLLSLSSSTLAAEIAERVLAAAEPARPPPFSRRASWTTTHSLHRQGDKIVWSGTTITSL